MFQSVHADGAARDGPTLPPPQRLPGERVDRVEPLLQKLRRFQRFQRQPHAQEASAAVLRG